MATTLTSTGITFPDATTQTTAAASAFPSGTLMLFQQTTAPTGWTKQTTHDNKALRVVTGTAGSGGTTAFTSVFTDQTPTISVGATTLSIAQMPSHTHPGGSFYNSSNRHSSTSGAGYVTGANTGSNGSGSSHTHSGSSTAITLGVQYVDLIIASKD